MAVEAGEADVAVEAPAEAASPPDGSAKKRKKRATAVEAAQANEGGESHAVAGLGCGEVREEVDRVGRSGGWHSGEGGCPGCGAEG